MDLATKESDHATKSFLQWFVDEQVEEESNVEQILNNLKLINGEGQGLLMMDRKCRQGYLLTRFLPKHKANMDLSFALNISKTG